MFLGSLETRSLETIVEIVGNKKLGSKIGVIWQELRSKIVFLTGFEIEDGCSTGFEIEVGCLTVIEIEV